MMPAPMHVSEALRPARPRAVGVDVNGALNLVGWLVKYVAAAFAFPTAIAVGYGEPAWPFLLAGAATFAFGLGVELLTDGRHRIGPREGYLVVALIWLLIAGFGALPYLFAEPQLSRPLDALFESMSGFSTTGSSVLTDIDALSRSMAMWRQFTTWIGGVGIIVLFLAVLPRLRVGGRQALFRTEAAGPELGLEETIRESARRFVVLYVAITAAAIVVLAVIGWTGIDPRMTLFEAVAHAFATIATAGFSTNGRSLEPFAPATQWAIVFFMVVAGTNFALLFVGVARRSLRPFARDDEFRVYIVLLAVAAAIVWLELVNENVYAGGTAVRQAVVQPRGDDDHHRIRQRRLRRVAAAHPARPDRGARDRRLGRLDERLDQARPPRRDRQDAAARDRPDRAPAPGRPAARQHHGGRRARSARDHRLRLPVPGRARRRRDRRVWSTRRWSASTLSSFDALAAAATTLGGAGPGLGFAGPMGSFAPFSDLSTFVLTALMYLGRLEIIPVLVIFTRSHWRA